MTMMNSSFSSSSSSLILLRSLLLLLINIVSASASASCKRSCGNITDIRFPFSVNNSLSGVDPSCPSSYMDNPYLRLFCDQAEGKLYMYPPTNDYFNTLEVISIHNDSLIAQNFVTNTGRAEMIPAPDELTCNASDRAALLLPPVGIGPYVISDENKFGSFGCTLGTLEMSDLTKYNGSYLIPSYYDHVVVGGCAVLLPENRNNTDCGNHTCCVATLPPVSDLHLRYAAYYAYYSGYGINTKTEECKCSNNYATLFHPEYTDFDNRLYQIKITWALPVILNDTTSDPTSVIRDAELNKTIMESPNYACTRDQTSEFIAVREVQGYRCKCKDGFTGDGYANGTGCTSKIQHNIPYIIMQLIN